MKQKGLWNKILWSGCLIIAVLSVIYFIISYPQLEFRGYTEKYAGAENKDTLPEFTDGTVVEQKIRIHGEYIKGISVKFANYGHVPEGTVEFAVTDQNDKTYVEQTVQASDLPDSDWYYMNFNGRIAVEKGTELTLTFRSYGAKEGSALTLWASDGFENCDLTVNGTAADQTIIMEIDEYINANYPVKYWIFIACIAIGFIGVCLYQIKQEKEKKTNQLGEFINVFVRYKFLLSQLLGKEFKNKYRRSYLGILWSLLNPLLMMVIVSSVFSFIFRFDIEKFPVYLILGQITFNFFSEATQVSVATIVGSGQLIKKVYLPKCIFPLSKVLFSFVNFLISFIAVAIVMIYFGVRPNINMVFLPLFLVYYFVFTLGISLLLSACMVFLRDTQHLYSLMIVALGYLTPVFYPISSLAPWMRNIMSLNPLYHYISYLRTIFLYGQCPSFMDNVICLGAALISIAVGMKYFFNKQKKFILYI